MIFEGGDLFTFAMRWQQRQGGGKVNYGAAKFANMLFYLRLVGASADRLWL